MTADQRIPDILLERYRLNELPIGDATRVAEQLARDSELRARLAALERSDQALHEPIDRLGRRLAEKSRRPLRRLVLWALPAAAILAGVVVTAVVRMRGADVVREEERIKGSGSSLALYRRTPAGSERLADGTVARTGDVIRIGYRAAGHAYGAIVSVDGAGSVTMHLPLDGGRAAALKPGTTVLLDQAYELDDAPRWERFYFVVADSAFDVGPVEQAAREAARKPAELPPARLALPRAFEQANFTLQKESRP